MEKNRQIKRYLGGNDSFLRFISYSGLDTTHCRILGLVKQYREAWAEGNKSNGD